MQERKELAPPKRPKYSRIEPKTKLMIIKYKREKNLSLMETVKQFPDLKLKKSSLRDWETQYKILENSINLPQDQKDRKIEEVFFFLHNYLYYKNSTQEGLL